ncbi:methyl-accepting chemotaxis protein [Bdellovibrio sp. NC01]|uniref:HAMP domain-containing methyl-accepting chemotaxis protein n=1 Tax=Bdellovibrio sp. NC01 TaxID=2220073 RepID=UPI0011584554|nr:methyl-accepting chemotaxis protein [Bdellovibrio sp. NC01]QDK37051.1 hypothetical protein DOE51_05310 [Bdellovibrio sp. NC01]
MKLARWLQGIRGKLVLLAIIPLLSFAYLFYKSDQGITKLKASNEKANQVRGPSLNYAGRMATDCEAMQKHLLTAILDTDVSQRNKELDSLEADEASFEEAYEGYEKIPHQASTAEKFKQVEEDWPKMQTMITEVIKELKAGQVDKAEELALGDFRKVSNEVSDDLLDLSNTRVQMMAASTKEDAEMAAHVERQLEEGAIIGFLLVVGLSIFLIKELTSSLETSITKLSKSSEDMAMASEQLFASSEQSSQGSTEAAASIEETVAALHEITSMVQKNSDASVKTVSISKQALSRTEEGEKDVDHLADSIREISKSSQKIKDIIQVMDDIAFQTNILALNAAIEAARAGQAGKGFSIVATSMQELAQKSASSAKDVADLIHVSVQQVEDGVKIAEETGVKFKEIHDCVRQVSAMSEEVAHASQQQSTGLQQINQAMTQLDTATQMNSASSEEVSASAEDLTRFAQSMQTVVGDLRIVLDGRMGQAHQNVAEIIPLVRKPKSQAA